MTPLFFLLMAGPAVLGILLGIALSVARRRRGQVSASRSIRAVVGAAAGLTAVLIVIELLGSLFPFSIGQELFVLHDWRFVLPLLLGIAAILILLFPHRPRRGGGTAELHRRTPFSYAGRGALALLGILSALSIGLALFAGFLSKPDEEGHYRMFWIELGDMRGGSDIYGWYFSLPALAVLAVLLAVVVVVLVRIAQPPLTGDIEEDRASRRFRTRAVLSLSSAAVALHLSAVLAFLAATSTMSVTPDVLGASVGTSFAALTPLLSGASGLATVVGTGLCVAVLLSALPLGARRAQPVPA